MKPRWLASCVWWNRHSNPNRKPRYWRIRQQAGCSISHLHQRSSLRIAWTIADTFNIEVLNRVVTVLVIACPHALGLAIPLVVAITTAMGARNGILVRNRLALEAAREIDVVIFDKTGTLTKGQFGVVDIATADGWDADRAFPWPPP